MVLVWCGMVLVRYTTVKKHISRSIPTQAARVPHIGVRHRHSLCNTKINRHSEKQPTRILCTILYTGFRDFWRSGAAHSPHVTTQSRVPSDNQEAWSNRVRRTIRTCGTSQSFGRPGLSLQGRLTNGADPTLAGLHKSGRLVFLRCHTKYLWSRIRMES